MPRCDAELRYRDELRSGSNEIGGHGPYVEILINNGDEDGDDDANGEDDSNEDNLDDNDDDNDNR